MLDHRYNPERFVKMLCQDALFSRSQCLAGNTIQRLWRWMALEPESPGWVPSQSLGTRRKYTEQKHPEQKYPEPLRVALELVMDA